MSWTKPKDVTDAWIGDDAPTDEGKLQIWINKAEREIRNKVEDLQKRIDAEADEEPARKDLEATAIDVVVAMVTRVFRNPRGERSVSESIGAGPLTETASATFGGDNPGSLEPTKSELEKLQGARRGGAFEISLIPANYGGMRSV
ncbi:hypothetical protein G7068_03325 [Leucobacter viscericola]|uniref:Phage protein Gp19/Gp15/Gp42 n=1 Tax=Leucobacter viscericola TaxID=2714935 RepID=A0A6G7XCZ7_9MICO|nr:Gp19/Gp15/Gp42 family protein [Leucobacter viscericola]QIK62346.1 hypothetical protein G7068_03325 [Leucobacter viscericola]